MGKREKWEKYMGYLKYIPDKYGREIYIPKFKKITNMNDDGNFDKIGGIPSADKDHIINNTIYWPKCQKCKVNMQFVFQLTPPKKFTVQFFMCVNRNCEGISRVNKKEIEDTTIIRKINYDNCIEFDKIKDLYEKDAPLSSIIKHAYNYYNTDDLKCYEELLEGKEYQYYKEYQCYKVDKIDKNYDFNHEEDIDDIVECFNQLLADGKIDKWCCDKDCENNDNIYDCECFRNILDSMLGAHGCHPVKYGGYGMSAQGFIYDDTLISIDQSIYIPWMWGDAGFANISEELELIWDCY